MNNIWLVMIVGGLITFSMRFSLIYLFGKFEIPESLRRALHYVPPAVLSAIIFPEIFLSNGALDISLSNARLPAGILAIVAAWYSRSTLVTILIGMAALFFFQWIKL
ncbi:MAG TPA: AzlD domain-containing protein [Anaerolineales bacterium]|nr:AzlD domain-containing protein [Anaerolineales bacterium]HNE05737.1 AzlD domain-containing protein [Anaerolineales bacterium]HNF95087.1 AzlD domain-containing protein [Anaerolineales bacterium]HNH26641.1 AzlD domain-containing protein [Anaerolineales bacterium]HNO94744.1 AzlD domain-containing protein [Anaerolineales bacterium]